MKTNPSTKESTTRSQTESSPPRSSRPGRSRSNSTQRPTATTLPAQKSSSSSVQSHPVPTNFDASTTRCSNAARSTSNPASSRYARARASTSTSAEMTKTTKNNSNTNLSFHNINRRGSMESHDFQDENTSSKSEGGGAHYEVIDLRPAAHPIDLSSSFTSIASHLTADSTSRGMGTQLSITDDLEGIQRNDLPSHWDVLPPSHWNLAGSNRSKSGSFGGRDEENMGNDVQFTRGTKNRHGGSGGSAGSMDGSGSSIWSGDSGGGSSGSGGSRSTSYSSTDTIVGKRRIYMKRCLQATSIAVGFVFLTAGVLFFLMDQMGDTILAMMQSNALGGLGGVAAIESGGRMMVELPEDADDGEGTISWVTRCEQLGILPS